MKADLHMHTIYSDGSDAPEVLLEKATRAELNYIALTDHDTTKWLSADGAKIRQKAWGMGIDLLRGLELSTHDEKTGKIAHILGFWPGDRVFLTPNTEHLCKKMSEERTRGSLEQARRIREMGYDISDDEVRRVCSTNQLFKHDVLKVMMEKGFISEVIGDFYRTHFQKGQDCYIDLEYISTIEAVDAIAKDGGFAVLAHPGQQDNLILLERLKETGLWGVELHHPSNNSDYEHQVRQMAEKYSLYMTGGSDYHGTHHRSRGLGQCTLSDEEIAPLLEAGLLR